MATQRTQRNRRGNPLPKPTRKIKKTETRLNKDKDKDKDRTNLPQVLVRGNVIFILRNDIRKWLIPWRMVISILFIFAGAMGTAITAAHIANTEVQINRARAERTRYQYLNATLADQVNERYTREEVERIASERLGMFRPDPSQIIEINVPLQSYVHLNTAAHVLPGQNYFWQEIVNFVNGIVDRIFGG